MTALSKIINPDIQEERKKVSFNIEEFTNWYHGGAEKVAEKRFLGNYLMACLSTALTSAFTLNLTQTSNISKNVHNLSFVMTFRKLFLVRSRTQRQRVRQLPQPQRKIRRSDSKVYACFQEDQKTSGRGKRWS